MIEKESSLNSNNYSQRNLTDYQDYITFDLCMINLLLYFSGACQLRVHAFILTLLTCGV